MSALPLSYWLWQVAVSVFGAAIVVVLATWLHRVLRVSQASRSYWIAAWLLAATPMPLGILLDAMLPAPLAASLPVLGPLVETSATIDASVAALSSAPLAWASGAGWLSLYVFGLAIGARRWTRAWLGLRRVLRASLPIDAEDLPGTATRDEFRQLQSRGIELLMVDAVLSPFVLRWPRSMIVLPRALLTRLDDAQLTLVLRHEAAHLARKDPHWALLIELSNLLLWFNPLLRLLARRVQLAAELACDAAALGAQRNMRRAYAEAYLETLRMSMKRALPCPAIAFSPQDQGSHRMRIQHIVHGDPRARKRPLRTLALAALALALGSGFVAVHASTNAATAPVTFAGPIIEGRISSGYGQVRSNISAQAHRGIDLTAARGTPVKAPAAGVVTVATPEYAPQPNYGTVIMLDHGDGWQSVYAHLDSLDVAVGDRVDAGQQIGRVGSTGKATGPHVHVEVLRDGKRLDPASVISTPVAAKT
jgi:beta-lactamase regulating signal transducer with metallopeptidase domain